MLLDKKIPLSYVLGKVKYDILYVTLISVLTYVAKHTYQHAIPDMPIAIPAFIGTAISILISFKINQSYDRWWEARKIWGGMVNDSRTFVLQLQAFVKKGNDLGIKRIAYRHIAWLYSLGKSLRGLPAHEQLESFLSEEELRHIQTHKNKPLAILQLNNQDIANLHNEQKLDTFPFIQLNSTLVAFSNQMGMCERIKSTVFPSTYRKFLHWVIYLFIITLSVALQGVEFYYEYPLLLAISLAFFLLEKSAKHLQDPFSNMPTDTAMTTIARNIEINIKQLLNEKDIPSPYPSEKFYSL